MEAKVTFFLKNINSGTQFSDKSLVLTCDVRFSKTKSEMSYDYSIIFTEISFSSESQFW